MKRILLAALAGLTVVACDSKIEIEHDGEGKAHHEPHVVTVASGVDFATTLAQLRSAIDARGFKTFDVIDHAAGAASVGQSLSPTTLVIFGNPKGGAPVMQAEQLMGLELPLKILVTEDTDGAVSLTHRDMKHTFHEYSVDADEALNKMAGALAAITAEASTSRN